jgi:ubiquitin-like modifier-activating enzyme 5
LCRLPQARISSPEALAAAAAAAAVAAEAEANAVPVHEENDWGIEVVADDAAVAVASTSSTTGEQAAAAAAEPLPEGLQFSLPQAGVDEQELQQEAVKPTDASLDELTSMLSSLNK